MRKKSRTQYSLLNMLTGFVGYFINTVFGYVCRMVFVRVLSEEYLGITGLLTNFLSMLSLAELGIGSAIIFSLYKPIAENDEEKIASLMRLFKYAYRLIGIIVAVLGVILVPCLTFVVGDTSAINESIYLIYGIFLFNTVSSYFFSYRSALITAFQRSYIVVGVSYACTILQSIVQIGLLVVLRSYLPYLIIQTIFTWVYNIVITLWAKKDYPFMDKKNVMPLPKEEKIKIFNNVKNITAYKVSGILVNNTDNLVITYFSGLGITGLASNYTLLINMLDTMIKNVFNALTASVGNLNAVESKEKQYNFFKVLNLTNFWLYGFASIGIICVTSNIVDLCFGEKYVMSWEIPLILAVNLYMVGMQNAVWTFKNTMGMFKYGRFILFITAAINVVGDIILGYYLGVFGIFLATAISRLVTNTWYEPFALFKFGFGKSPLIYLKKYLWYLVMLLASGATCFFLCSLVSINLFADLILKIIICTVVSNGIFLLAFYKTKEFAYLKTTALRIINKGLNKFIKNKK
ncbi:MAG: hypothetical protein J1E56_00510 [Ruminococcus sp.]|nr:hypothetical protein [Ruminococcus sp.]